MEPLQTIPYTNLPPPSWWRRWCSRPLSVKAMIGCFFCWTWPMWVSIADVSAFERRPLIHFIVAIVCGAPVICVLVARAVERKHLLSGGRQRFEIGTDLRRGGVVALLTLGFLALCATSLPFRFVFWLHRPQFEAVRREALATLEPGDFRLIGRIGLFAIDDVRRGENDSIGFRMNGGGIDFNASSEPENPLDVQEFDGGDLGGG